MHVSLLWTATTLLDASNVFPEKHCATIQISNREPTHNVIESFCTNYYFIVVTFDAIPLTSANINISSPFPLKPISNPAVNKPHRLHYGHDTAEKLWNQPRDSYFYRLPDSSFTVHLEFPSSAQPILGFSFVIQLQDGQWLRNLDNNDFSVGLCASKLPSYVEIPMRWPFKSAIHHSNMISLYRPNAFWLSPNIGGNTMHSIHQETQFLLAQLNILTPPTTNATVSSTLRHPYVSCLFISDAYSGLRASLFPLQDYAAIRIETGLRSPLSIATLNGATVCHLSVASDPYCASQAVVQASSTNLGTFSTSLEKLSSKRWQSISTESSLLNSLGYCTWDAFEHHVTENHVLNALSWLSKNHIPIGYAIVDDGWQSGGEHGPNFEHNLICMAPTDRPTLVSFEANAKFSGSLKQLQRNCSSAIFAWTSAIGYWGGVCGTACNVDTTFVRGALSKGLHSNNMEDPRHWEKRYEISYCPDSVQKFLRTYFEEGMAKRQGVSGVKVDAQSILGILSNREDKNVSGIPSSHLAMRYRKALTKAVENAFPNNAILNSMACGPEIILASGKELSTANTCWRTSNDHAFPGKEENAEAVAWHIISNAMNTLLLGEIFPVVDWDMFRSCDTFSSIHAASRIVSGGPMYVSDETPFNTPFASESLRLLNSLITADGRILRCDGAGRPTLDCLFRDARCAPWGLFKIFNRSAVVGVIGLFNLCCDGTNRVIQDRFKPSDIADFGKIRSNVEYISLVSWGKAQTAFRHKSSSESKKVTVSSMSAALAHVSPVLHIGGELKFAVLGQPHLMNCGATVASITIWKMGRWRERVTNRFTEGDFEVEVEVCLKDCGIAYFWLNERSKEILSYVRVSGSSEEGEKKMVEIDGITFLTVSIPPAKPYVTQLYFKGC